MRVSRENIDIISELPTDSENSPDDKSNTKPGDSSDSSDSPNSSNGSQSSSQDDTLQDGQGSGPSSDTEGGIGGTEGGPVDQGSSSKMDALAKTIADTMMDNHVEDEEDSDSTDSQKPSSPNQASEEDRKTSLEDLRQKIADAMATGKTTPEELAALGALGLDKIITPNTHTISHWRRALHRILSKALAITSKDDPNTPSARIEGELGREIDTAKIANLVFSVDCSGSMGPQKFKECLNELSTFLRVYKMQQTNVYVIYWGGPSEIKHIKLKGNKDLVPNIIKQAPSFGSTAINTSFEVASKLLRRPDMVIVFTDGHIFDTERLSNVSKAYLKQINQRLMWVMTKSGSTTQYLGNMDPKYQKHIIIPTADSE